MNELDLAREVTTEEDAMRSIACEFPKLSRRIISEVLHAYCTRTSNVHDAALAARRRLRDATVVR